MNYTITIISNNTFNKNITVNSTNITISDLVIGSNYSFIIIPIDTAGREGPPSSSIQYIWNGMNYTVYILIVFLIVPVQVINVSWYQISYDSIIIWWKSGIARSLCLIDTYTLRQVDILQYPPLHYIITVHNTTITTKSTLCTLVTTDTNITITGLSPTINYTVTIIPVNIIGYGPSVNINGITIIIMYYYTILIVIITSIVSSSMVYMTVTEYIIIHNTSSTYSTALVSTKMPVVSMTTQSATTTETASSCVNSKLSIAFDMIYILFIRLYFMFMYYM